MPHKHNERIIQMFTNIENALGKIQHHFMIKKIKKTRNRRRFMQHYRGHLLKILKLTIFSVVIYIHTYIIIFPIDSDTRKECSSSQF